MQHPPKARGTLRAFLSHPLLPFLRGVPGRSVLSKPALVIATLTGDDLILCQITSQRIADRYAITLESSDFSEGGLKPYEQH